MPEWISGVISSLKELTPAILIGVAVCSLTFILMTPDIAIRLDLTEFQKNHHSQFGLALIASLSLLLGQGIWAGCKQASSEFKNFLSRRQKNRNLKKLQKTLHSLTPDEKDYIAPYILNLVNTRKFDIGDGIAAGLVVKNILFRPSNIGDILSGFSHNMQPWAREYLESHPECLVK